MQSNKRFILMMAAMGVGLSVGWLLPAQQPAAAPAATPQWKGKAESDLVYVDYTGAKDDKGRLAALDKWSTSFPDSELWLARDVYYLNIYDSMKDYRKLIDRSKALLVKVPNHYLATIHIIQKIPMLTPATAATPADVQTAEQLGRQVMNNPETIRPAAADMTDAQWDKARPDVVGIARQAVIWSVTKQGDNKKLEAEYRSALQADPTQAGYSYYLGLAIVNQKDPTKYPEAVFHWAHAVGYEGKNALPAAQKTQIEASLKQIYTTYHGSLGDLDKVMILAKNTTFPPADYKIVDKNTIAQNAFRAQEDYDKAHPIEAWWRDDLRGILTGADGAKVWVDNFADALLPAKPPMDFSHFKGRIVSMTPAINPTEIVLAVEKEGPDAKADAKLVFKKSPGGDMPIGSEISFKGVLQSYQKEPFMVTFNMNDEEIDGPELVGWTGVAPPDDSKAKAKQKGKAPATKGKGGAKGKAATK